ncbi:amino acid transmembrane transporter [Aureococcus anophagefferens]|nr:amino acid transmembrane transporter [Aureococcus anophagefferens]
MSTTQTPSATFTQMFFFSVKVTVGVGALALPQQVAAVGYVWSAVMLVLVGVAIWWGSAALLRAKRAVEESGTPVVTYQDVARGVLGVEGQRVVEVSIVAFQLGVCCVYFYFIADELADLFPASSGGLTRVEWILVLYPPVAVVSCLRYLRDMADVAKVAFFCYGRRPGTLGYRVSAPKRRGVVPRCQIENTLFGGRRAMKRLLACVLCSVFTIFTTVAFLGALAFTDPSDPLTESVYDAYGGVLPTLLNVFVLVSVAMTYPLQFYAAVSLLERVIGFGPGATQARDAEAAASVWITAEDGGWASVALRCALVAVTALVAIVVPSLSDLIDIIGAPRAWLALTIPALLDLCAGLSMKAYPMTPMDVSVASFVLTTSFILAICGTTSVIMAL